MNRVQRCTRALLVICVLTPLLTSCESGPREVQLTGSVFIVTRGGESIKLGLVQVGVLREADIPATLEERAAVARAQRAELEPRARELEQELNRIKAQIPALESAAAAAERRFNAISSPPSAYQAAYKAYLAAQAKVDDARRSMSRKSSDFEELRASLERCARPSPDGRT